LRLTEFLWLTNICKPLGQEAGEGQLMIRP